MSGSFYKYWVGTPTLSGGRLSSSRGFSGGGFGGGLSGLGLLSLGLLGLGFFLLLLFLLILLLFLSLLLLAEERSEKGSALARARAALGILLLVLFSRSSSSSSSGGLFLLGLLVIFLLGFALLSLLLSLLLVLGGLSGGSSNNRLGQLLKLSLVTLAGGDGLLLSLGLGGLGLKGGDPAVALSSVGSLERVLVAVQLEEELIGALLGNIGDVGLFAC